MDCYNGHERSCKFRVDGSRGSLCLLCVPIKYECACIPEFRCGSALAYPGTYSCSPLYGFHVLIPQLPEGRRRKEQYIFLEGPKAIIKWVTCLPRLCETLVSIPGVVGVRALLCICFSLRQQETLKTCLVACSPILGALVWFGLVFEKGSVHVAQTSLNLLGSRDLTSHLPSW